VGEVEVLEQWHSVLRSGVHAQALVPGAVAVGGTAAALYAGHRLSLDTDHLLSDLRSQFADVVEVLEGVAEWRTARLQPPVLILGSLDGVEVGFRQARRDSAIATVRFVTPFGELVIPTLDEMIGMKAVLAYRRGATRDFLDFAALAETAGVPETEASLRRIDERYGSLQTTSVALGVAKALTAASPTDLDGVDLPNYKGLRGPWHDWTRVVTSCQFFGKRLGEWLVNS